MINTGDEQDSVMGVLCQGLELEDIKALDCFEGDVCNYLWVMASGC